MGSCERAAEWMKRAKGWKHDIVMVRRAAREKKASQFRARRAEAVSRIATQTAAAEEEVLQKVIQVAKTMDVSGDGGTRDAKPAASRGACDPRTARCRHDGPASRKEAEWSWAEKGTGHAPRRRRRPCRPRRARTC